MTHDLRRWHRRIWLVLGPATIVLAVALLIARGAFTPQAASQPDAADRSGGLP